MARKRTSVSFEKITSRHCSRSGADEGMFPTYRPIQNHSESTNEPQRNHLSSSALCKVISIQVTCCDVGNMVCARCGVNRLEVRSGRTIHQGNNLTGKRGTDAPHRGHLARPTTAFQPMRIRVRQARQISGRDGAPATKRAFGMVGTGFTPQGKNVSRHYELFESG